MCVPTMYPGMSGAKLSNGFQRGCETRVGRSRRGRVGKEALPEKQKEYKKSWNVIICSDGKAKALGMLGC